MSQTVNPSPTEGDCDQKRTDTEEYPHLDVDVAARDATHERITDVRELEAGDEILVGERSKPITVDGHGTRPVFTLAGERTQHAVDASGDWSDAVSVLLVNTIDFWTGERRGEISMDIYRTRPVWRVDE